MKNNYLNALRQSFEEHAEPDYAIRMKKYMRNQFDFYGIPSPIRKKLGQEFIRNNGYPSIESLNEIIQELWQYEEREYQFFAMEMLFLARNKTDVNAIDIYEFMIKNKSWWDTVDYIAATLVGHHFRRFPNLIKIKTECWMKSEYIWLQRTALLFQLKYKMETNTDLLTKYILQLADSKEFFIRKAIGWTLREYSKTNPELVLDFVNQNESLLSGLSKREALKIIVRKRLDVRFI